MKTGIHVTQNAIILNVAGDKSHTFTMQVCAQDTTHALLYACFMKLNEMSHLQAELLKVVAVSKVQQSEAAKSGEDLLKSMQEVTKSMPGMEGIMQNLMGAAGKIG